MIHGDGVYSRHAGFFEYGLRSLKAEVFGVLPSGLGTLSYSVK